MGEIVLCVDRDIRRPVAMEKILPHAAEDPARRARFVEEGQVTGQLEHPNIVSVRREPSRTVERARTGRYGEDCSSQDRNGTAGGRSSEGNPHRALRQ